MSGKLEDLTRRLESGESLETIVASMRDTPKSALLSRCAVVRTFTSDLVDSVFRHGMPGCSVQELPFQTLIDDYTVLAVSQDAGLYRIRDVERPALAASASTPELHAALSAYFERKGPQWEADSLYHALAHDPQRAIQSFNRLYEQAEEAFDLARCQNLLDGVDTALRAHAAAMPAQTAAQIGALLGHKRARLRARGFWSDDYFRTARYLPRPAVDDHFKALLTLEGPWLLHVFATGGMGKTMSLRHCIARYCVPRDIACARIDLDTIRKDPNGHVWPIVAELARQLNTQVQDGPFESVERLAASLEDILDRGQATQVIASSADDVVDYFLSAMKALPADRRMLLVFDTLENARFDRSVSIDDLLTFVGDLHDNLHQGIRVVLSGRYDLRRDRLQNAVLSQANVFEFPRFSEQEAAAYLVQKRQLEDDERLAVLVSKGGGLPFKLALLADIVRSKPDITAAEIQSYNDTDLLYLIKRVIERIGDPRVQWVVRYGVVPRRLRKSFVRDVMQQYLPAAMARQSRYDNPDEDQRPARDDNRVFPKALENAETPLDIDALWQALRQYAAGSSWVSESPDHADELIFHGDVLNPMRRMLEPHPVFTLLHEQATAFFESRSATQNAEWPRNACEAIYHRFQRRDPAAEEVWRERLEEARAAGRFDWVQAIAQEILGPEYIDDEQHPLTFHDGTAVVSAEAVALANTEFALACLDLQWQQVSEGEADPSEALRDRGRAAHERARRYVAEGHDLPVSRARWARLESAAYEDAGNLNAAIEALKEGLRGERANAPERSRLLLHMADLHSDTAPLDAVHLYAGALAAAESARPRDRTLSAGIALKLAQHQALGDQLLDAISTLKTRVDQWPGKTRGRAVVTLATIYGRAGLWTTARQTARALRVDAPFDVSALATFLSGRAFVETGLPMRALEQAAALREAVEARTEHDAARTLAAAWEAELQAMARSQLLDPAVPELYEKACRLYESVGAIVDSTVARHRLAQFLMRETGNLGAARRLLEQDVEGLPTERVAERTVLRTELARRTGAYSQAVQHIDRALALPRSSSPRQFVALCLEGLAAAHQRTRPDVQRLFHRLRGTLETIAPAHARAAALGALTALPALPGIGKDVLRLLDLDDRPAATIDPRDRLMLELNVAEAARVFGGRKEARALLRGAMRQFEKRPAHLWPLRRVIAAAERAGVNLEVPPQIAQRYLEEHHAAPDLCAAFLIEQAEWALEKGRYRAAAQAVADATEHRARRTGSSASQWDARLLIVQGRLLDAQHDGSRAATLYRQAAAIYDSLEDAVARDALARHQPVEPHIIARAEATATIRIADETDGPRVSLEVFEDGHALALTGRWRDLFGLHHPPGGPKHRLVTAKEFVSGWKQTSCGLAGMLEHEDPWRRLITGGIGEPMDLRLELADALAFLPFEIQRTQILATPSNRLGFVGQAPGIRTLFRAHSRSIALTQRIKTLQSSLRLLVSPDLAVDGLSGGPLPAVIMKFQHDAGLLPTGRADRETARRLYLKVQQHAEGLRTQPPLVLLVRASAARQLRASRGDLYRGAPLETLYEKAGFSVRVLEDPSEMAMWNVGSGAGNWPAVVHVLSSLEEDVSSGAVGLAFESARSDKRSEFGGSSLSARALGRLIHDASHATLRPLVILDTPHTQGDLDLTHQCFLRNALCAEVFQESPAPALIGMGLAPSPMQALIYDALIRELQEGQNVGAIMKAIRNLGALSPVEAHLDDVIGTVGTALFTDDPDWMPATTGGWRNG